MSLLSKDLTQSAKASNEASAPDPEHPIHEALLKINLVNKLLKTDFDFERVKSNTKPFPDIKTLCINSKLSLKNSFGADMYHVYSLYSELNHLRLGSNNTKTSDKDIETCYALEYFIEIYIKFYRQLLETEFFSSKFLVELDDICKQLGLK